VTTATTLPPAAAEALRLLRAGFSIIPLRPRDKRTLLPWAEFQQRRAHEAEVAAWWRSEPEAGISIVCGRVSSLVVLDEDPRNGGDASLAAFPVSAGPTVRTGADGRHYYYVHSGQPMAKIPGLLPGVDIQGEGAYVVAPPSIHPNGTAYTWEPGCEIGALPLPALPFWLRSLIRGRHGMHRLARTVRHGAPAPIELTEILGRLRSVRRAHGGWTACCPAHEDASPSLSVALGESGRVLLHCFAGCSYSAIRTALEQQVTE
jgi:hypothetical protein